MPLANVRVAQEAFDEEGVHEYLTQLRFPDVHLFRDRTC